LRVAQVDVQLASLALLLALHAPPHRRPVLGRSLFSEPFLDICTVSLVSDQNEILYFVSRACVACDLWLNAGSPDATDAL